MSDILKLLNDENEDPTVTITDTDGNRDAYEFLDIVFVLGNEYIVLSPVEGDGYVDIFKVLKGKNGEQYERETNEVILDKVFDVFRRNHEDDYDFI